jgi:RND family efflux transporter MFP subunit
LHTYREIMKNVRTVPRFPSRQLALRALLLAAALALGGARCAPDAPEAKPPAVDVAHPVVREIVEWDEYSGRVEAVERVEVRARVSGYIESIRFVDGQIVEPGDLLFVIDPRPYRAALSRAEAELASARASLALAENDARRAERLMQSEVISRERFETQTTARRTAAADVEAAKAAVEQARLDLEFTEVRAPIRGRVGRDLVTTGNLVSGGTPDATLLTTLVSLDPIHVYFDADERAVLKYERLARSGERASSRDVPNPVLLALADEQGFPHRGQMDFVDNQLDPRTGTMRGRAVFPNPDLALTPGLFARVRLLGSGRHRALLLPDEAIGTDQSDRYVLVVDEQSRVESRIIEPGPLIEGLRVVRSGLAPEDRVVIRGLQAVQPGSSVEPRPVEIAAPERFESLEALLPGASAAGATGTGG